MLDGKIEAIGKKVNKWKFAFWSRKNRPKWKTYFNPGIVDMRVFVGEPGL